MRLLLSFLLLALLADRVSAQSCSAVAFCLSENEQDCATNSNVCAGGTYCRQWATDPVSTETGEITGTCVKAATVVGGLFTKLA